MTMIYSTPTSLQRLDADGVFDGAQLAAAAFLARYSGRSRRTRTFRLHHSLNNEVQGRLIETAYRRRYSAVVKSGGAEDFLARIQPEQVGGNGAVAAARAAGVPEVWLGRYGRPSSPRREFSAGTLRPIRMWLPLGSVSVNSCMPHGMSAIGVTATPAATNRACQSSTSSVTM